MRFRNALRSIRHAVFGKPVSYEEHRAAQASLYRDQMVIAQQTMRNRQVGGSPF